MSLNQDNILRSLKKSLQLSHQNQDLISSSPELTSLIVSLLNILSNSITHKNALQILKLSVQYSLNELRDRVIEFIAPDFDVFYNFSDILEFADTGLVKSLLQRNDLKYDELSIYCELSEWISRGNGNSHLLELVRLPLIEPSELMGKVVKEGLVTRERALEALVYALGRRLGVDVESYMDLVGERFSPRTPHSPSQNPLNGSGSIDFAARAASLPRASTSSRQQSNHFSSREGPSHQDGTTSFTAEDENMSTGGTLGAGDSEWGTLSRLSQSPSAGGDHLAASPKELHQNSSFQFDDTDSLASSTQPAQPEETLNGSNQSHQNNGRELFSSSTEPQNHQHHHHHHNPDPVATDLSKKLDVPEQDTNNAESTSASPVKNSKSTANHQNLTVKATSSPSSQEKFRSPLKERLSASSSTSRGWDVSFSPTQFWHQSPRKNHRYKIIVGGDHKTGKSFWIQKLLGNAVSKDQKYTPTVGASVHSITFYTSENFSIQFELWDMAGSDATSGIRDVYYLDTHGALLFFDVTDAQSYKNVTKWKKELQNVCGTGTSFVTVGNKVDMNSSRQVYLPHDEPDAFLEMSVHGDAQNTMYTPLEKLARKLESNRELKLLNVKE